MKATVTLQVSNIRNYMASIQWKGKAGETDRAIMEYLLNYSLKRTTFKVCPGIREIMDNAAIRSIRWSAMAQQVYDAKPRKARELRTWLGIRKARV